MAHTLFKQCAPQYRLFLYQIPHVFYLPYPSRDTNPRTLLSTTHWAISRTAVHEELSAYFERLVRANQRFSDEAGVGWQSDRGRVFIVLGEPDQLIEPQLNDMSRNRQQVWIYQAMNLQLTFFDQTGTGRWRLTQSSEVRFETEFRRRLK